MWSVLSNVTGTSRHVSLIFPVLASCGDLIVSPSCAHTIQHQQFSFEAQIWTQRASDFSPALPSLSSYFSKVSIVDSVCFSAPLMSFSFELAAVGWENTKPCVLVAGRKLSMCVNGLLQLLFFGPSAVAKRSLFHEAGQEFVDIGASLQKVFSRLLRFLLCLVGCNF